MTDQTRKLIDRLYEDFYQQLLSKERFAMLFKDKNIREKHHIQAQSLYRLLTRYRRK